ncbi:hypothetical protein VPNG_06954 [Cytospora leucostoma]|uniref:LIM zinc-binding domain-containing protein n=1 Tax=Cytospora leucostoma TaxID=1230097 RepID=A0A423WXH8_9PEZI|nr:hypothetical protein VPNG_06954 [Cytospora leucostoma]
MGEHVCGTTPQTTVEPDPIDSFMPFNKSVHDKISVVPPVDTAIANRSYSRQPLTPLSLSSGSGRSVSPKTPGARPSIGRADDYFAPTIANEDQPPLSQPTRPGGYGGYGEPDRTSGYAATSPKSQAPSLLSRLDAATPGPFGAGKDASPLAGRPGRSPPRRPSQISERPGTSSSMSNNKAGSMAPPRPPRNDGYAGFGPPQREHQNDGTLTAPNRSRTFPRPSESLEPPFRTPSAPGTRPDRSRQPSLDVNGRMGPDTSRPPPPRKSLVRPSTANGKAPNINLAAEFGAMNPYHSPSVSVSSLASQRSSQRSYPSSNTSPPRSATPAREPSNPSDIDSLMDDIRSSIDDFKPKNLQPAPDFEGPTSPETQRASLGEDRYNPAGEGGRPPSPPPSKWDDEMRQDPAIQGGLRLGRSPLPPSPTRAPNSRRDPAVQASRGTCKGCGQAITGKSVSSADGRLSGRYHKACFVCASCREPFQTAEFYVHGDRPYCKQHYHQVNGSLCGSCGDGIEGQYLEDESTRKHHVSCFRCRDCQVVLRDGYFDVDGRPYCEKDAWRRLQPRSYQRSPSMSSQRSYGSNRSFGPNLAPPGRPGMRAPPGGGPPPRTAMQMGNGRMGQPMGGGPPMGLAPPAQIPRMQKRMTRLGIM